MRFSDPGRLLLVLVALLCLTQGAAGIGIDAGVDNGNVGATDAGAADTALQTTPNNTTVQQENPEEVDESGDTEAVRSYLAQQLSERLSGSSIEISQGQYEQGRSVLGDEYDSTLEQYVDVSGGTGDNPGAESFEQARESQQEYGDLLQEYNETYQEYQAARDAGNSTRARELARELDQLADRINRTGGNVTRSYTRVENTTGANLGNASRQIQNTSRGVTEQQQTVVSETFVETRLSVRTEAEAAAFGSPALIQGEITLANGTALANETAVIRIGEQTRSVETDADGAFSVEYRPTTVPADTSNISVRYRPADGSVYLGSDTTLALRIRQTAAALTTTVENASAAFSDRVLVTGQASVNGTPVPNVRVRVSIGGVHLSTVETGADGRYSVAAVLPSTVAAGEAPVEARIVPSDRAVRSDPATDSLRVARTATALSLTASQTATGLQLRGQLETADGQSISEQAVELRINGTTVATVDTNRAGQFERQVAMNEDRTGVVTVTAVFEQPRGNLERSTAEQQVDLGTESPERGVAPIPLELLAGGGAVIVSLAVIGWLMRADETASEPAEPTVSVADDVSTGGGETQALLEQARASAADPDDAVLSLYAAVRRSIGGEPQQTHWEFYADASAGLDADAAGTLERLTEAYERAVFSPSGVDADTVDDLVERTERLLDRDGGGR